MPITFTMSKEESDLVLEHVPDLEEATRARLRFGLAEGHRLRYTLSEEQFDILLDCIDDAASLSDKRKVRRMLGNILEKLEAYLAEPDDEEWDDEEEEGIDFMAPWLAPVREQIQAIMEDMKGASPREIQAEAEKVLLAFGNQPNEELAGYTPNQLQRLREADLESPDSPIQCRGDLTIEQLRDCWSFQDMRIFLHMLAEEGGTKATANGSLNRAFVRRFVDAMTEINASYADELPDKKNLNEDDVENLWSTHRAAHAMDLVIWLGQKIFLTERGDRMMKDANAGELFRELFIFYWHSLDFDPSSEYNPLDEISAYSFSMLHGFGKHARGNVSFDAVAEKVIPRVLVRMLDEEIYGAMTLLKGLFYARVFSPLRDFGLANVAELPDADENDSVTMRHAVVATPLFDAFFSFDIE
jgi:hypothetical protein